MKNPDAPHVNVPDDYQLPTLEEVDAFPMPVLLEPRLVKEHGYTEQESKEIVREAKRMLYLSSRIGGGISPSNIVDDGWHAMLMFTRSYWKFANFIGRYVHHEPAPGPPDGGRMYRNTKQKYEEEFGFAPDPKYWP